MTISENSPSRSLWRDLLSAVRYYLGNRTGLIAIAAIGLGAGAYFNWGWLVAAGLAPLIVGVLPCAAMCALGLCMSGQKRTISADQAGSHGDTNSPGLPLAASNGEKDTAPSDKGKSAGSSNNRKGCR